MQADLKECQMLEESTCQAVVLIAKGGGDYYVIGLVEVVWKMVTVILNFCLTTSITFHNVPHGFWEGRINGTTYLEAKLIH